MEINEYIAKNHHFSYDELAKNLALSKDSIRKRYRRLGLPHKKLNKQTGGEITVKKDELLSQLAELDITPAQIKRMLRGKKPKPRVLETDISDDVFTFGIVSDTHLCSTEEKLNELHTIYEIFKKRNIIEVVNAGDLLAGWKIYKGQENEVHTFGAKNQAQYVIDHYPRVEGITTSFITGNHDLSWWKLSGFDIGDMISEKRPDMKYLGQYQGELVLNGVKIRLLHPDGGGAYAISYSAQKIVEQMSSGNKPHILVLGHDHTAIYFFHRNIHVFRGGCFEGQTSFLLRKGKQPQVGGWTVKVRIAKDLRRTILSITPTFIPFIER